MFNSLPSSLGDLKKEDRDKLSAFLVKRNELMVHAITLNKLRIEQLANPTPENDARVADFNSTVIAPLRDGMSDDIIELLDSAVDIDSIIGFMPMILTGVLQYVNIPLALTVFGIDPDTTQRLISRVKDYITQSD